MGIKAAQPRRRRQRATRTLKGKSRRGPFWGQNRTRLFFFFFLFVSLVGFCSKKRSLKKVIKKGHLDVNMSDIKLPQKHLMKKRSKKDVSKRHSSFSRFFGKRRYVWAYSQTRFLDHKMTDPFLFWGRSTRIQVTFTQKWPEFGSLTFFYDLFLWPKKLLQKLSIIKKVQCHQR